MFSNSPPIVRNPPSLITAMRSGIQASVMRTNVFGSLSGSGGTSSAIGIWVWPAVRRRALSPPKGRYPLPDSRAQPASTRADAGRSAGNFTRQCWHSFESCRYVVDPRSGAGRDGQDALPQALTRSLSGNGRRARQGLEEIACVQVGTPINIIAAKLLREM